MLRLNGCRSKRNGLHRSIHLPSKKPLLGAAVKLRGPCAKQLSLFYFDSGATVSPEGHALTAVRPGPSLGRAEAGSSASLHVCVPRPAVSSFVHGNAKSDVWR